MAAPAPLPSSPRRRPSQRGPARSAAVRLLLVGAICATGGASAVACGQIAAPPTEADDDDDPIVRPRRDGGNTGSDSGRRDGGRPRPNEPDARNEYVDPECGDIPPPSEMYDCDPIAQTGCGPEEACSPFVDYPSDPCDSETYGAFCIPAGTLEQGEACDSQLDCAVGYLCLITGAGTTCGRACSLDDPDACTDGLVCVSTDVNGVGACY